MGGTADTIEIELPNRTHKKWGLLNILDFDNDRKMMTVIVKHPTTHEIIAYTKGADTNVFACLTDCPTKFITDTALDEFAEDGLRTLVYGKRVMNEHEYEEWKEEYRVAQGSVGNREFLLKTCFSKVERDLELLGVTAIEDKLQKEVPETINLLSQAGIKIWVLTGDKLETAINIGYNCTCKVVQYLL